MMKAIRVFEFGGPEVLKVVKDVPLPVPNNKQVLIKVKSAGINPVDTYIRSGTYKMKPTLPYTPGSDGSGLVMSADESSRFKKGDMVYFRNSLTGSYAEYTLVDPDNVFSLNSKLTFQAGAALGIPYFTAYRALVNKCRPKTGQSLLVHGASGAVGLAACQMGKHLGLRVLGTASGEEGRQLVLQNGAEAVFNHSQPGYKDEIMNATSGKGVDNIIEMLANVNLESDLELAASAGRVVIVGSRDKVQITPRHVMAKELTLLGVMLWEVHKVVGSRGTIEVTPRHAMAKELTVLGVMMGHATKDDINESAEFFSKGMEEGWLRPHVGQQYQLEDITKAHTEVVAQSGGSKGKLVLNVQ